MLDPLFKCGADASRLHEELLLTPVGGVVTYGGLNGRFNAQKFVWSNV